MRLVLATFIVLLAGAGPAFGLERFPPPDFESGHNLPSTATPGPRAFVYEYLDVAVLLLALTAAAYLALKKRSRRGLFILTIFSLIYFGFVRKGCVCSIGSIQDIVLAFFDSGYTVPLTVLAFFLIPLIFTLFFGRVFCAAVCPLGAIQDLVLLRAVLVPNWLEQALRLFAYAYLGAAVLFAATGSAFLICRYDPFVSFFRLDGSINMLILGFSFLLIAAFVGRPYCRYLCPYGVLLRHLSSIAKWRVSITPSECVKCRLCEDSCPYAAINFPTEDQLRRRRTEGMGRLAALIVLLPILVVIGDRAGSMLASPFSRMHATVRLTERVWQEQTAKVEGTTDASEAFRATGRPIKELYAEALDIKGRIAIGSRLFGAFIGMVVGLKLIQLAIRRRRIDYQIDRAHCLACGRCFAYCPVERSVDKVDKVDKLEKER